MPDELDSEPPGSSHVDTPALSLRRLWGMVACLTKNACLFPWREDTTGDFSVLREHASTFCAIKFRPFE